MEMLDAARVILVAQEADGGCYHCFENCMDTARSQWPEVDWERAWAVHGSETGSFDVERLTKLIKDWVERE